MTADPRLYTPCPQCGADLVVPHQVGVFTCPWCRATLRSEEGVPIHYLRSEPRFSPTQALEAVRAWAAGSDLPVRMEKDAAFEVGDVAVFPFLRARRSGLDTVVPAAPMTAPEIFDLGRMPGELTPIDGPLADGRPDADDVSACNETLRAELKRAVADADVIDLLVEYRAYYPVTYSYKGERYTLAVDAANGRLAVARRPARRDIVGERLITGAALAVLLLEALFIPGLWVKVGAVVLTAGAMYPLLRWVIARYG